MTAANPCTKTQALKARSFELLSAYRQSPSTSVRNQLVELNIGLVRKEAYRWIGQCSEGYDDLLQIGSLGLIRAIERFDPTKGAAFSSFALPYIRGEIQHYLRDRSTSIRIPRRFLELQHRASQISQRFLDTYGRSPTEQEIAQELEITLQQWQDTRLACQNRSLLSLDAPLADTDNSSSSLGESVLDRKYHSFQLAEEDRLRLQQALVHLESRTRDILEYVFLQDLTQKEVAEQLGISAVTVSRRVRKGLDALKCLMVKGDE
ncbi:MAG: RNA polymerase sigma factor SigF [Cyanobacteria bacterium P01_H01_bin.130]